MQFMILLFVSVCAGRRVILAPPPNPLKMLYFPIVCYCIVQSCYVCDFVCQCPLPIVCIALCMLPCHTPPPSPPTYHLGMPLLFTVISLISVPMVLVVWQKYVESRLLVSITHTNQQILQNLFQF